MKEVRYWGPLLALAGLGYLAFSLQRHFQLGSTVFDLGIHYQTLWLLAQGHDPWLSTRGLQAYADHFNPVAGPLALLVRLGPSPVLLLVLQATLLALAALPLYGLARRALSPLLSLGAAALLLVQPTMLFMDRFDFHFVAVFVPASLLAAWALETGCARAYAWALVLMLSCTESAGLTVIFLVPIAARLRGPRWGLATLGAGLTGLAVATLSLRHYGEGLPTQYLSLYSRWGDSPGAILSGLANHPGEALAAFTTRTGWLPLLLTFAGLPLLSPLRCLPAVPVVVGNLLSWRETQQSLELHYNAAVVGFLAWATVHALGRLPRRVGAVLVLVAFVLALQGGPLRHPGLPLRPWPPAWGSLAAQIPAEASLAADNYTGTRFAGRPELYLLPNPFYPQCWGDRPQALLETLPLSRPGTPGELRRGIDDSSVDYVLTRLGGFSFPEREADRWLILYALLGSRRYGVSHFDGQLLLLRRGHTWSDHREKLLLREFAPP